MMQVDIACLNDAADLHRLIVEHAEFEGDKATLAIGSLEDILRRQRRPSEILIARAGSHAVGYASLTTDFSLWHGCKWGHLDCLFVRDGHRSIGTGRLLLDAARERALSAQVRWMEWQTPTWNTRAVSFYLREGATIAPKTRLRLAL